MNFGDKTGVAACNQNPRRKLRGIGHPKTNTRESPQGAGNLPAMIKKAIYWLLGGNLIAFGVFAALAVYTNVPTHLTDSDKAVFANLSLVKPKTNQSYDEQIATIRHVQEIVFERAPMGAGIPDNEPREPADLMRRGHGLCFDRSRTFDKVLKYYGMESRHVYLLFKEGKSFLSALFHYGQPSHAVTEVKTSKGWMFVDSNMPWVALTRQGEPVSADEVWQRYAEFDKPPPYLAQPWWSVRGMYSRKGQLYEPFIPFPALNWPDFLGWWVLGQ